MPDALTAIALMGAGDEHDRDRHGGDPHLAAPPADARGPGADRCRRRSGRGCILGIGLAHKSSVEGTLKIPFATPAKHMDEYLQVLLPALTDRKVSFTGDIWSAEVEGVGGTAGASRPR